jgi:hypothetical protein
LIRLPGRKKFINIICGENIRVCGFSVHLLFIASTLSLGLCPDMRESLPLINRFPDATNYEQTWIAINQTENYEVTFVQRVSGDTLGKVASNKVRK